MVNIGAARCNIRRGDGTPVPGRFAPGHGRIPAVTGHTTRPAAAPHYLTDAVAVAIRVIASSR